MWDRGLRSFADDVRNLILKWHVSFLHPALLGRVELHILGTYFGQGLLGAAVSFYNITFLYNKDRKRGLVYRALDSDIGNRFAPLGQSALGREGVVLLVM